MSRHFYAVSNLFLPFPGRKSSGMVLEMNISGMPGRFSGDRNVYPTVFYPSFKISVVFSMSRDLFSMRMTC